MHVVNQGSPSGEPTVLKQRYEFNFGTLQSPHFANEVDAAFSSAFGEAELGDGVFACPVGQPPLGTVVAQARVVENGTIGVTMVSSGGTVVVNTVTVDVFVIKGGGPGSVIS